MWRGNGIPLKGKRVKKVEIRVATSGLQRIGGRDSPHVRSEEKKPNWTVYEDSLPRVGKEGIAANYLERFNYSTSMAGPDTTAASSRS